MFQRNHFIIAFILLIILAFACSSPNDDKEQVVASNNYEDLVSLSQEFHEFQKPKMINGVPDYTAAAMEAQRHELVKFQTRLATIDPSDWPISQRVDYLLVRAEMNGLEFDHRVLRPWSRDPGFYVTTYLGFGPRMYGALRIPELPLPADSIADFQMKLQAVPKILDQAKGNLKEAGGDLVRLAIRAKEKENAIFQNLASQLAQHHPDLVTDAERAKAACNDFHDWLKESESRMTEDAGIGVENYNWYLKNVQLFPYTWEEVLILSQREYERAIAFLKLEENKNRKLPPLEPVRTVEDWRHLAQEANQQLLEFLRDEEIFTVPDYLIPGEPKPYIPPGSSYRRFFDKVRYRDPRPLRAHNLPGHRLDSLMHHRDKRPIRGTKRLYFIDGIRAEGWATGLEEMMMQLGFLDKLPRTREITYVLLVNRAARAIADLKMHSNEFTFEEAFQYLVDATPYWMEEDDLAAWFDLELYLRQPGYGMGYLLGKIQLEQLISDRANQLGDKFNLRQFHDEFLAAGMIPITLIRWEMTGLEDQIKKIW
jgi:uncharacterized protein (DUF885 family)